MKINKNEKTAEIVGLCFGDGSLTRRHSGKNKAKLRFQLRGHITEDREHYNTYIEPLFDEVIAKVPTTIYKGKKPYYGVATESSVICNYLVSLGVPIGIKKELKVPEWISKSDDCINGFLRGFFDTDGCIFCQKNYSTKSDLHNLIKINLGSTSKQLIDNIYTLLKLIGIKSVIKKPLIRKESNWNTLHVLRIDSNQDVEKWFKIIGSKNPKHVTKFRVWKKFGFCPPHTDIEQRRKILNGEINVISLYKDIEKYAEVAEPGQMRKVEDNNQKPCLLVSARVQITSSALST